MRLTIKNILILLLILALCIGVYWVLAGKTEPASLKQGAPAKNAKEQIVKTAVAEIKAVPINVYANGYVTAINTVDVHPRMQQIVHTIYVVEGQDVHAGQLLFTLDNRSDTSNVNRAEAQVARDRADLEDAEITLKRNLELLSKNFVSQAVVDSERIKVDSLKAALRADQAAAEGSNIALDYNQISASISGRIGILNVHPGSLAQPVGLPMVTITQIDPVAVSFTVPERELSSVFATYPKGDAPVYAQLPDGIEFKGKLIFIDNSTDPQSGTIRMKAQFTNHNHLLWPGTFVKVKLVSRILPESIVVPAQAVVNGPAYQLVYILQPDNTVQAQKIEVLSMENGLAAITGLKKDTRVVVEGMQNLRSGAKVKEEQILPPNDHNSGKSRPDSNKKSTDIPGQPQTAQDKKIQS